MSFKVSVFDKLGKHVLLKYRNGAGIKAELCFKFIKQSLGQYRVADSYGGCDCS